MSVGGESDVAKAFSLLGIVENNSREDLYAFLTRVNKDLPEEFVVAVEAILKREHEALGDPIDVNTLPRLEGQWNNIILWRGDITRLSVGAIVNAANDRMLGCFQVGHKCIDNVIHAAAGPRLRMECRKIMQQKKEGKEETGKALLTHAYCLPCKYVVHTVGPIYQDEEDIQHGRAEHLLRSSYRAILDCCAKKNISSVALCCISTGVFGYPQREACHVALTEVRQWFADNPSSSLQSVVFNTFTETDTLLYAQLAPQVFCPHPFAIHCRELSQLFRPYSPFTASLCDLFANDLRSSPQQSVVWDLVHEKWGTKTPRALHADAVALRLAGALNFFVLLSVQQMEEGESSLVPYWPPTTCDQQLFPDIWYRIIRPVIERRREAVAKFMESPPQTNEVRRSAVLYCGLQYLNQLTGGLPFHTLELGASAGLNLFCDKYKYRNKSWSTTTNNNDNNDLVVDFDWTCESQMDASSYFTSLPLHVISRRACDLHPVRHDQHIRLLSYVWPDERDRVLMLQQALQTSQALCQQHNVDVQQMSADDFLRKYLTECIEGTATVVLHSIFYQYPSAEVRKCIADHIADVGERCATPQSPLFWLRFEAESVLDPLKPDSMRYILDVIQWPGNKRTLLAEAHPHGRTCKWLA